MNLDFAGSQAFQLKTHATRWFAATPPTLTAAQQKAEVERVMALTEADEDAIDAIPRAETDDVRGQGTKLNLNYNPSNFWTLQLTFNEKRSINSNLSTSVTRHIAKRMAVWSTIKDPTINPVLEPQQLWWRHNYGGSQTAEQYYESQVASPLLQFQSLEGKARPQLTRYAGALSTSYRLAGLVEPPILKRVTVGGALRWQDKSAIGFYGKQQLPATINELDIGRPIWSNPRFYADAFVSYRTRLLSNKVGTTWQLNVRNLQETGRLQPVGAYPDGTPYSYRIVDPRQFILSATFDL